MSIAAVTALLRERLGIDPESLGTRAIEKAISVHMRALGSDAIFAYASRIITDAEEFQALAEEIGVPETWFFRGGIDLFTHLAALIRESCRLVPPRPLFRVLSAPCSSGEEAYSLAIALAEAGAPPSSCIIEAIDISRTALEKARAGRYRDFSFRQTEPALRDHYFRPVEGGWEIAPALRDSVQFRQGNLIERTVLAGDQPYDLIFCRNLLIYLHAAARARVLDNLMRCLAPDGLLCTGHAEPIQLQDARFELVPPERSMLFRRRRANPPPVRAAGFTPAVQAAGINPAARSVARKQTVQRSLSCAPAPDALTRARQLADTGHISEALEACTAHLHRAGPSADAYALLGILRQARHEKGEAVRCFEKALYLQPDHDEALTHLMLLCQQLGHADRATILRRRLERARSGEQI
jgi:chemotaxis protein methyltransferase WspC